MGTANLASQDFWEEDYYRGLELPVRPDPEYPFDRCLMRALEELAPVKPAARVLEIGCAPARWLLWYAERFQARVSGLDYSPKGVAISRENLAAGGVAGKIHEGDLFSDELCLGDFDVVFSLGVIEHFDDFRAAFARHARLLRDGGRLVLGMPNFRGLIGFLQAWSDPEYLALHNRAAMRPLAYSAIGVEQGLRLDGAHYVDGVDPDMIRVSRQTARVALMPLRLWRRLRLSDHVNHRLVSSYLLLTFTKPSGSR